MAEEWKNGNKLNIEKVWAVTKQINSRESYIAFITQYPASQFTVEARNAIALMDEDDLWDKALTVHTIPAYLAYLDNYPNGRYREDAEVAILIVDEEYEWEIAIKTDTVDAYRHYMEIYPDSKYVAEAKLKTETLAKQALKTNLKTETISLQKTKQSTDNVVSKPRELTAEQRKHLAEVEEKNWLIAKEKNKLGTYLSYKRLYPEGKYLAEADRKILEFSDRLKNRKVHKQTDLEHLQKNPRQHHTIALNSTPTKMQQRKDEAPKKKNSLLIMLVVVAVIIAAAVIIYFTRAWKYVL